MQRWLIALIVGLLYLGVACWIVQSEGRAYREAVRYRRAATIASTGGQATSATPRGLDSKATSNSAPENTGGQATSATLGASDSKATSNSSRESTGGQATSATLRGSDRTSPTRASGASENSTSSGAPTSPSEPRNRADAPERKRPSRENDHVVPNPVDAARAEQARVASTELDKWANQLDLSRLSIDDERRLGALLHASIMTTNPPWRDGPSLKWVEQTATPLLEGRAHKDFDYTFTIIDSEDVNAFSHPGGYIYVTRGLLDFIGEGDDFALEFVLAHEIAHVDFQHALKIASARSAEARKAGASTLAQFSLFIALGFPDQQEYEADAWAYQQMIARLDRTKHKALSFLRRFEEYANSRGFGDGHSPPLRGRNITDNHFPAHPAAWKRLERLTKGAPRSPAATPKR